MVYECGDSVSLLALLELSPPAFIAAQWAGHPANLCVEIEHRGFKMVVAKRHLEVAHISTRL